MATLRKQDLSSRVSTKMGVSMAQGQQALNAVLESVHEALAAGDKVVLTGFGTFETRQIKQRQVRAIRGPQAGQMVTVPPHRRVGFTPGTELTQSVRK